MFACRVEYNGKTYFGKGRINKAYRQYRHDVLEGSEEELTYIPKESAINFPSCWVVDGAFESLFRSGFSIMKNPPADKFNLQWKHFVCNSNP